SSPDRAGSGLLPRDREKVHGAQDDYSELGLTAKLRASHSVLKVGTLLPKLPSVLANDSRLLPQTFQGAHLNSAEFAGLTFDAGRLRQVSQRDSSDSEDMTLTTGNARGIVASADSDRFDFAGLSYKWTPQLTTGYNSA
ncbi:OprD family outer membrane porin, partial [Pseudomonas aeruginosa]|uniref:OprD family outer membrane porin n=1 Tax=Pseudomonas aeruginosa TaxID=287 RepID=UPI00396F313C